MEKITIIDEMQEMLDGMRAEYTKFIDKENNAAGARVRKICQSIKTKCQDLRIDVQSIKKNR